MKVVRGRVEQGRIVLGENLPEGTEVTVLVAAGEQSFELDEADVAMLRASIEEADRGDVVTLDEVLKRR
jgi:predicted transcriptional regulator